VSLSCFKDTRSRVGLHLYDGRIWAAAFPGMRFASSVVAVYRPFQLRTKRPAIILRFSEELICKVLKTFKGTGLRV
jgi:hypothetical protein